MSPSVFSTGQISGVSPSGQACERRKRSERRASAGSGGDTVSFSPQALALARQMQARKTAAAGPGDDAETAAESPFAVSGPAADPHSASLQTTLPEAFRSFILRPEYGTKAEPSAARRSGETAGKSAGGDESAAQESSDSGLDKKIEDLEKKLERIYASDMPEVAKERAANGIKEQLEALLAQKGAGQQADVTKQTAAPQGGTGRKA